MTHRVDCWVIKSEKKGCNMHLVYASVFFSKDDITLKIKVWWPKCSRAVMFCCLHCATAGYSLLLTCPPVHPPLPGWISEQRYDRNTLSIFLQSRSGVGARQGGSSVPSVCTHNDLLCALYYSTVIPLWHTGALTEPVTHIHWLLAEDRKSTEWDVG